MLRSFTPAGVTLSISVLFNVLLLGFMLRTVWTPNNPFPPSPPRVPQGYRIETTPDPRVVQKLSMTPIPSLTPTATPTPSPRNASLLFASSNLGIAFHYPGDVFVHEENGSISLEYLLENGIGNEIKDTEWEKLFYAGIRKSPNTGNETLEQYAKRILCQSHPPLTLIEDPIQYCQKQFSETLRSYRNNTLSVSGIQLEYNPYELPIYYILFQRNNQIYMISLSGGETGADIPEYGKQKLNEILSTLKFLD